MSAQILPINTIATPEGMEDILLGGGCFWCTEAVYLELNGVTHVESGYAGGFVENPTYTAVCTGTTGHDEVVKVTFDPTIISLESVLEVFFTIHDPTTLNRQGNDIGTQYRSAIFYLNAAQKETADAALAKANAAIWDGNIVTEVTPFSNYYAAEAYHQNYYNQNTQQGYCNAVVTPKVAKFRKLWASSLKK